MNNPEGSPVPKPSSESAPVTSSSSEKPSRRKAKKAESAKGIAEVLDKGIISGNSKVEAPKENLLGVTVQPKTEAKKDKPAEVKKADQGEVVVPLTDEKAAETTTVSTETEDNPASVNETTIQEVEPETVEYRKPLDDGTELAVEAEEGEIPLDNSLSDHIDVVIAERKQSVTAGDGPEAAAESDFLEHARDNAAKPNATLETALDTAAEQSAAELSSEDMVSRTDVDAETQPVAAPAPEADSDDDPNQALSPHIMAPWNQNGVPSYPGGPGVPGGPGAPNAAPQAGNPNTPPAVANLAPANAWFPAKVERRTEDKTGAVVGAGLLGYLYGRRRGRIKTEKRLKPVQKKLETEVKHVREPVNEKASQVKKLAAEQYKQRLAHNEQKLQNEVQQRQIAEQEQRLKLQQAEKPMAAAKVEMPKEAETPLAAAAPAAVAAMATEKGPVTPIGPISPEHAKARSAVIEAFEAAKPSDERDSEPRPDRPVRGDVVTLSRVELQHIGEGIAVEGTTLRHIYGSGLISERGLRYVVSEYLQGKDIKRALANEIIEKQRDFERDPVLRDHGRMNPLQAGASLGGGMAAALPAAVAEVASNSTPSSQQNGGANNGKPSKDESSKLDYNQHDGPDLVVAGGSIALVVIVIAIIIVAFF